MEARAGSTELPLNRGHVADEWKGCPVVMGTSGENLHSWRGTQHGFPG